MIHYIFNYADLEWVFINTLHVLARQYATGIKDLENLKSMSRDSSKINPGVEQGVIIFIIIRDKMTHS